MTILKETSYFRTFGAATFELRSRGIQAKEIRDWMGKQGWTRQIEEPSHKIELRAQGQGADFIGLGAPCQGDRNWVLSELEYRCVIAALELETAPAVFHAATCCVGDGYLLLVAPHEGGKTTMAVSMNAIGFPVVGDDIAMVDEDLMCQPLPRPLRLRPFTQSLLSDTARELAFEDPIENILRLDPRDLSGESSSAKAVSHLVVLDYRPGASLELSEIGSDEALQLLVGHCFEVVPRSAQTLDAVLGLLSQAQVHRFSYELAPLDAARALMDNIKL